MLARLVWSEITNTVISGECTDLHGADQSHAPQDHCFFGWREETGKKASMERKKGCVLENVNQCGDAVVFPV